MKNFRMTLLLGPPGAGKTTLLLALAGKLDRDLRVSFLLFKQLLLLYVYFKNSPNNLAL